MSDTAPGTELTCSARGCRSRAQWALLWNNPSLHTPDRRKTWLACDDHRDSLGEHLRVRSFLRQCLPVSELGGPQPTGEPVPPGP